MATLKNDFISCVFFVCYPGLPFKECPQYCLFSFLLSKLVETTTVFKGADLPGGVAAPPSCISILEKEFRHHYPMFQRRMDMVLLRQPGSEQNRDFARRLVEAADQSDLERLTRSEFLTMCMITNTNDEALKGELRKLREPDWARVCVECENFDRMNTKPKSSVGATPIEARQVTSSSAIDLNKKLDRILQQLTLTTL